MPWLRVDDTLHTHPKVVEALDADEDHALAAMGLWTLGLTYCGNALTDGHLRRSAARRIAGSRLETLAAVLVRIGLWEVHPSGDGWLYHDYLEYNPSKEQVLTERKDRKEKAKNAAAKRWNGAGSNATRHATEHAGEHADKHPPEHAIEHASQHGHENAPVPARPGPSRPPGDPAGDGAVRQTLQIPRPATGALPDGLVAFEKKFWISAYERGVDKARPKSGKFTFNEKAWKALVSIVEKQCDGEDRKDIAGWIEQRVFEFVSAIERRGDDTKLWSSYSPDGLLRWYNEQRPGHRPPRAPAPAKPVTPPPPKEPELTAAEAGVPSLEALVRGVGRG